MKIIKKKTKRLAAVILAAIMIFSLSGCNAKHAEEEIKYRLNIVTTLFPYYDIVRAIADDTDDIHISMTVAPGQDSHSFEPTPADVIRINEADVFIYNGGSLETWVDTLLESLDNDRQIQMKMMDYVDVFEEEHVEGMDIRFDAHDHEEDGHSEEDFDEEHAHDHEEDEHIWTSPVKMQILTQKVCDELCRALPEEADSFRKNAEKYIAQLQELDTELHEVIDSAEKKEIIFADKFPLLYFVKEYDLKYYAAFAGCGSDMEPSAKTIAFLIDKIKEDKVKAVFYLELSSHAVADVISEDTGAVTMQFNTCHNITRKQFDDGVTYMDLMKQNVNSLRSALH